LDCSAHFSPDLFNAKLPSVPEEYIPDDIFRGRGVGLELLGIQQAATVPHMQLLQQQPIVQQDLQQLPPDSPLQYTATIFAQPETDTNFQTSGCSDFQQGTFVICIYYRNIIIFVNLVF
jgi:hypothetical protein